jgi:hypothetical protein
MPVPISGAFNIFGTSNTTIQGAIVEGGASSAASATDFNTLKSLSDVAKFNSTYAGSITSLSQVTNTLQYRGYPAISTYTVTVLASTQATFGNSVRLWYKFGESGTWTLNIGTFTAPACPSTITRTISGVPNGTILYIGMTNSVNTNIRFNAQLTPVCGGGVFNTYCGLNNNLGITINGNTTIYSAVANSGGFITC